MSATVKTGLSILRDEKLSHLSGLRIGVLCHSASVDENLCHIIDILAEGGIMPVRIFAPEHGFFADAQDQAQLKSTNHPRYGIPIISLYGGDFNSLKPEPKYLSDIDIVLIDLQDVGSRYYTFVWTAALFLNVAGSTDTAVWVLDRPNPIGAHIVEGPTQDEDYCSFVGLYSIPIRHGLTIGELLNYFKTLYYRNVSLDVINMQYYRRRYWYDHTKLPWVMPSPNMPTLNTAIVYPGMCLLEGTNLSEGRGTTHPFEIFGAPFIEPYKFCDAMQEYDLPGVQFRPLYFTPTFNKFTSTQCGGAQIHIKNRETFKPVLTAFAIIRTAIKMYPNHFKFRQPPYEYETRRLPFDILSGSSKWRKMLLAGAPISQFESEFNQSLKGFIKDIQQIKLYEQ